MPWPPRSAPVRSLVALALLLAGPPALRAATLSGFIRAAESGEALPYANVQIPALKRGTLTNQSGYYVLSDVAAGHYDVTLSCLGYKPLTRAIDLATGQSLTLTVELVTAPTEIAEIEVKPGLPETSVQNSTLRLETSQLTRLTAVGEADVFRAVQSLPGVSTLSDFSAGLYVRGGSADQNLILLDDIDVYNPSHLFGFFSTFNVDAVKTVDLQKGGFPAQYGGRLSSLLDVHNRDGNRKKFQGVLRTGLIASSGTLEGPWAHGSWMVSGRHTHLSTLARAAKIDLPYAFHDVQSRFNFDPGPNDRTSVSYYSGRDRLNWDKPGLNLNLDWGNATWGGQWTHVFGPRLFSHTVVGHSRFDSNTDVVLRDFAFRQRNRVQDLALKQNLSWSPGAHHKFDAGAELKSLDFGFRSTIGGAAPLEFAYRGVYGSIYAQDAWKLDERWRVQTGLRLDHYSKGGYWRVDPRLSLERALGDAARVHATYGRYHQFLNLVSQEGASFADMWFPVDGTLSPGQADHYIVGTDLGPFHDFELSVEAYYKPYRNVVEFSEEFSRSIVEPGSAMNQLFNRGTGHSVGADVYLRDRWRGWDGWLGYSFGDTRRTITGYNFGREYHPPYDRRHQVVVTQSRALGRRWNAGLTFHYGSGQPLTLPAGRYTVVDVNGRPYDVVLDGEKGAARLPDYHRLDLSLTGRYKVHGWNVEPELQIVNAYNHRNVYIRTYDTTQNPAKFDDVTMLPFLPTIGVKVEF